MEIVLFLAGLLVGGVIAWAVAYGWRQEQLAENARAISDLGKQLYERLATVAGYLNDVGTHLGRTVGAYNQAVGSWESRVLPSTRRFQELGVAPEEEFPTPQTLATAPRALSPSEMNETDKTVEAKDGAP